MAAAEPAGSFEIPAWAFDRGNAQTFADPGQYADAGPMIANGGVLPWGVEYDVEFPVAATYTLHVRYAAAAARPMELTLDGKGAQACCGGATGSWNTSTAKWEETAKLAITQGKHTIRLTCQGAPPHIVALKFESPVAFPEGWKLERPKSRKLGAPMSVSFTVPSTAGRIDVAALRASIEETAAAYGSRYANAADYLKRLDALEKQQQAAVDAPAEELEEIHEKLADLRTEAMLAHPLLAFDKLLFVKRLTYCSSHIYTDHFDGSRQMGGNLCILSPVTPDGAVTEIAPQLDGGLFGRIDLSPDARRIVFAYKAPGKGYRLYEIGVDGSGLRQLTFDGDDEPDMIARYRHGYDDLDPCYLPNGKIMFASTRSKRAVLCHNAFTSTALHVIDADGGNLRCISGNTVNEFAPCVLDDGRVIYTRWEYVDKGCGDVQSLWSMHPDGSASAHVFKNNVSRPATLIDARSIPGSNRLVTIGAPHMPLAVGPVILVDTRITQRMSDAMTNLTPEIGYPGHGNYPGAKFGYFKEPFPLCEQFFLVSHNPGTRHNEPAGYGLYVLDARGNRAELYRDSATSCFQPIPLRARPAPPDLSAVVKVEEPEDEGLATLFMRDVYRGLPGIERGRVKYLRVMEDVAKPWEESWQSPIQGDSMGLQNPAVSLKGHFTVKKIHGVVPVHEDGSAFFTVPPDTNLFFQALDEDYMELQRMRTFVNLLPGEKRSCIGCHEVRKQAPALRRANPLALDHSVQALVPQPGDTGPRMVHYPTDVQPILDRHCVSCHSGESPEGNLDLSDELTTLFNRSYENLINRRLVDNIDVNPRDARIPAEGPLMVGSHLSKMVERMRADPCRGKLSREEFIRIVTWIDANAPYYGNYGGKKNVKWRDDPDFRPVPLVSR